MDRLELHNYLEHTARYLQDTGLRTVRIDGRKGDMTEEMARQYYDDLHEAGYLGNIFGYGGSDNAFGFDYFGVPAPTIWPSYTMRGRNDQSIVSAILSKKPGEDFINFTQPQDSESQIVQDVEAYGGEALFVPSNKSNCCLVASSGRLTLAAGNYSVNFRLKVPSNQASEDVAMIYVGERFRFSDWRIITSQRLAPTDFQQAGHYQDFTLFFTLDSLTSEIEFRIDAYVGVTDLYIDYIHSIRTEGPLLPVFAAIVIGLVIDPDDMRFQTEAPGRFTRAFEDSGGIVLSPDEFVAALNPEYMIDLATPILGSGHAAITQARQQLDAGEYLNSLITVRNALKVATNIETMNTQPLDFRLEQNYTNPFNPSTTIRFALPKPESVRIEVYNIVGQKVATLLDKPMFAGHHSVWFEAGKLASGVYVVRLEAGRFRAARKMLYLK